MLRLFDRDLVVVDVVVADVLVDVVVADVLVVVVVDAVTDLVDVVVADDLVDVVGSELTDAADPEAKLKLGSCGGICDKKLSGCKHTCQLECHPGACPPSSECSKKVVLRCPCKRLKKVRACLFVCVCARCFY